MRLGWLFIFFFATGSITYYYFAFSMEYSGNDLFKKNVDNNDYAGAFGSLILTERELTNRPFLGSETAPLTIMIAVDLSSEESAEAYSNHATWLKEAYVDTGKARLYHKYYLPKEAYEAKGKRYSKVLAAVCYQGNNTIDYHLQLFSSNPVPICDEPDYLYREMLETEDFMIRSPSIIVGIDGRDTVAIYGNPDREYIERRIRTKEIRVGI